MNASQGRRSVSVCMATYRGAEFVTEQLDSILAQLGDGDEVVVVDDASPDDTVAVVRAIAERDPRVRLFPRAQNRGYVRTFEEALGRAPQRPAHLHGLEALPRRATVMAADVERVKDYVAAHARGGAAVA